MAKTKTEELREKIHDLGVEIATLAVREYVGEAEDYIAEFDSLIGQILKACQKAGLAFVVKDAELPENPYDKRYHSPEETARWIVHNNSQQDMLRAKFRQIKGIELQC